MAVGLVHMELHRARWVISAIGVILMSLSLSVSGQSSGNSSSSDKKRTKSPPSSDKPTLDPGSIANGIYRNKTLGFSCKIPAGWVLRTEEMNTSEEQTAGTNTPGKGAATDARVLLAAFSRPPEARGEDVNASILVAAEAQSAYPGLKDAAQYLGPIAEVAKAQGFSVEEEPYEVAVGAKNLAREDFHKDVGSRVMRQSTLAMLEHGYAVSITVIGGTEDQVEELIDGMDFGASRRSSGRPK
jgi:hypothetical protein